MNFEKAQKLLNEAVSKGLVRGAAACSGHEGKVVCELAAGFVSGASDDRMQASTIFDLGTMTQALVTSTVIMSLTSHSDINLNTPACKFWSDFSDEGKEKVTLRHLLKHTSGLGADAPYYRELISSHRDWAGTARGAEFILGKVSAEELEYPPTYTVIHSNLGFMALGRVAEIIAAMPLDSIFSRDVSSPLGLANSFFRVPDDKMKLCARTFFCPERKKAPRGEVSDANAWAMGGVAGHAGLFSTASDTVHIAMALAKSLKEDGGLWPRKAVDEFIGPKAKYKLGWETPAYGTPLCGKFFSRNTVGFVGSTCVSLWVDFDQQIAVAIFASPSEQNSRDPDKARGDFESILPAVHDSLIEKLT